jgi:LysM repeat protein
MAAQGHDVKSQGKAKISKVVVKSAGHKNVKETYRVTRGDTLYRIAAKTKVPVAKLMKLNNLTKKQANKLKVGSIIRLS